MSLLVFQQADTGIAVLVRAQSIRRPPLREHLPLVRRARIGQTTAPSPTPASQPTPAQQIVAETVNQLVRPIVLLEVLAAVATVLSAVLFTLYFIDHKSDRESKRPS